MSTLLLEPMARMDRPRGRDVAVACRGLLNRLSATLETYIDRCLSEFAAQSRWGTPPVFFFHEPDQPVKHRPLSSALTEQRRILAELVDDYLSLLYGSVECRRMARAWPGFWKNVNKLALLDPLGQRLADTLALADDLVLQVILPRSNQGLRLILQGVQDTGELLQLVLQCLNAQPIRCGIVGEWQFYRPSILKHTRDFPAGIEAHAHWFWGTERLDTIPLDSQGERSLILAPATVRTSYESDHEPTRVGQKLDVLRVLNRQEVQLWLGLHEAQKETAMRSRAA